MVRRSLLVVLRYLREEKRRMVPSSTSVMEPDQEHDGVNMGDENGFEICKTLIGTDVAGSELALCAFTAVDHDGVVVQLEE